MGFRQALTLMLFALIGAACSTVGSPQPSVCAGVDAEMGGCDAEQPQFTAMDCGGTAREFGAQLNDRTLAILDGPEAVDGEARSVRLRQAMVLVAAGANDHLREQGLHADCDVPEFLGSAEREFTDAVRNGVGNALYDGAPPSTYEEWLSELARTLGVIDAEEER